MLSRVADALFWMSRYLERAEHVARLLDVCFHLELDLHGVLAGPHELHWTSLAAILQQQVPAPGAAAASPQAAISHWLTFDLDNPSSIMSCVVRARHNARSIRGTINSEMWRELNKLYWQLRDPDFSRQAARIAARVLPGRRVRQLPVPGRLRRHADARRGLAVHPARQVPRARRQDAAHPRHPVPPAAATSTNPADLPLSNLHWAARPRSCRAYEAYQRLYVGRVEPERVVEFLLLHPQFPRSVRFCLEAARRRWRRSRAGGRAAS